MDERAAYGPTVLEHIRNPRNIGEIENADGSGESQNPVCGDRVRFFLKIEESRIVRASFLAFGCSATIASSSIATEMIEGKTIEEALAITGSTILHALGGLPPGKVHASYLAIDAIKAAIADYQSNPTFEKR